jgi:chromosomal replication initiator protein
MGMGKTHLLQGVTYALRQSRLNVVYLTAEEFTADLITAIRSHAMLQFRERFRAADAVLIDDIQFVEGKDNTQSELVAIWDALRNRQRTMIFASDRLPRDMSKLSQDARSRFQAGPIAALDAPDYDLRCAIVDAASRERGLLLPPDVREAIAERIVANVRDLRSAVDQLHTYHQLTRQPITIHTARTVIVALGSSVPDYSALTLERVFEATARFYRLTVEDLASRKRTKAVVQARQLAMYLAREDAGGSLQQIGAALGGRDHTTVLHGVTRISQSLASDRALAQDLRTIRDTLLRESQGAPVERRSQRA